MARIARRTDEHRGICDHGAQCCPHSVIGSIIEGSVNSLADGLEIARLNDRVMHNCPHCGTGTISSASSSVMVDGIGVARIGDTVTYPGGGGIITTGSPKSFAGD